MSPYSEKRVRGGQQHEGKGAREVENVDNGKGHESRNSGEVGEIGRKEGNTGGV